jgi:hypothetical protein
MTQRHLRLARREGLVAPVVPASVVPASVVPAPVVPVRAVRIRDCG